MYDLTTISDFPPWSIDHSFKQSNAVTRSDFRGFKRQAAFSKTQVTIAQVNRKLTGIELPFFEYFVIVLLRDGADLFTDKYKDGGGVQSGTLRIVDGTYSVTTNGINHDVSCTVEIFR